MTHVQCCYHIPILVLMIVVSPLLWCYLAQSHNPVRCTPVLRIPENGQNGLGWDLGCPFLLMFGCDPPYHFLRCPKSSGDLVLLLSWWGVPVYSWFNDQKTTNSFGHCLCDSEKLLPCHGLHPRTKKSLEPLIHRRTSFFWVSQNQGAQKPSRSLWVVSPVRKDIVMNPFSLILTPRNPGVCYGKPNLPTLELGRGVNFG